MTYKLFIPGPVEVAPETYAAMTQPVFGHRSQDFVQLYQSVQPGLQKLFDTKDPVFLSTSSAWGVMEGALRNLTSKRVLNLMCGAFSDKWYDVTLRCGLQADPIRFEWGEHVDPEVVDKALSTGKYDVVTLVHNETSCGMMNPLRDLATVFQKYPDVITIVDTVSSFSVVPVPKDELGIDLMLTGSQKALALPPGLALFSASEKAMQKAATINNRGYYFDLHEFLSNHGKGMTPSTPVIPLIFALQERLQAIEAEGIEARYARHIRLNDLVREWVRKEGFELLPKPEFASRSLCCVKNTRDIDLALLNKNLKSKHGCVIDTGYGKLKGKTFRISNMGNETDETISELLNNLSGLIAEIS